MTDALAFSVGRFPGLVAGRRVRAYERSQRSGYLATRHLISLGHTEIRHVCGPGRRRAAPGSRTARGRANRA